MAFDISFRTAARLAALCMFIGCGAALEPAQALRVVAPETETSTVAPVLPVPVIPVDIMPLDREAVSLTPAPEPLFSATAVAPRAASGLQRKWQNLRTALRVEAELLALCRADRALCTPAAAKFLAVVDGAQAQQGRARLGHINRAVNLAIRPLSDLVQYGVTDVWATPLMSFASGAGDCEDYAIAKFVALREAGMSGADLRLLIVRDAGLGEDHAVVAARLDGEWLLLDNRRMAMLPARDADGLGLLAALDDEENPLRLSAGEGLPKLASAGAP